MLTQHLEVVIGSGVLDISIRQCVVCMCVCASFPPSLCVDGMCGSVGCSRSSVWMEITEKNSMNV